MTLPKKGRRQKPPPRNIFLTLRLRIRKMKHTCLLVGLKSPIHLLAKPTTTTRVRVLPAGKIQAWSHNHKKTQTLKTQVPNQVLMLKGIYLVPMKKEIADVLKRTVQRIRRSRMIPPKRSRMIQPNKRFPHQPILYHAGGLKCQTRTVARHITTTKTLELPAGISPPSLQDLMNMVLKAKETLTRPQRCRTKYWEKRQLQQLTLRRKRLGHLLFRNWKDPKQAPLSRRTNYHLDGWKQPTQHLANLISTMQTPRRPLGLDPL
mmetsp:Transcript_15204/g.31352  ORF Transcript_15204/g.31352 Transcript_15204/m.31352 type:complete len:262 (+) Transcript_15204:1564-2349(+)